jgi:hypothetical protein
MSRRVWEVLIVLCGLSAIGAGIYGLWRLDTGLYEGWCRRHLQMGITLYECRDYDPDCALYYNDCKSGERYEWIRVSENGYRAQRVP